MSPLVTAANAVGSKTPPTPTLACSGRVCKEEPRPDIVSRLGGAPDSLCVSHFCTPCVLLLLFLSLDSRQGKGRGGTVAAHPAVVLCLLPGVIGKLGKDALTAAKNGLEVDGLFRQCWRGLQTELIQVVTQITVVQC